MATSQHYAITRRLTANGDVALAGTTWAQGSPMREVAKRLLRTPLGRYLPDPTWGVDYGAIQTGRADAAAKWRDSVLAAMRRYVLRGLIAKLAVAAEVDRDRLRFEVRFADVRARGEAVVITERDL